MTPKKTFPRLIDNDRNEITVTLNGKELRGWSYDNDDERYLKLRMAREYCEGFGDGYERGHDEGYDHGYQEAIKPHV
jgi:hypothetical protein